MQSSPCHSEMMQTFGCGRCNDNTRLRHPTRHGSHQRVNARRLPGATGPEGHHAVSDPLSLKQLDDLQLPGWVTDQTRVLDLGGNRCLVQRGGSGLNNNQHRHHLQGPHDKLTQCSGHRKTPKVTDVTYNTVVGLFFFSYCPYLSAPFGAENGPCLCKALPDLHTQEKQWQNTSVTMLYATNLALDNSCLTSFVVFSKRYFRQKGKYRNPRISLFFHAISMDRLSPLEPTSPPDCRWQPPAPGTRLYRVGFLERGPRSGSGRAARLHRSKQTHTTPREQAGKTRQFIGR